MTNISICQRWRSWAVCSSDPLELAARDDGVLQTFLRLSLRLSLCLGLLGMAGPTVAAESNLPDPVTLEAAWCATAVDVTIDQLLQDTACVLEPMARPNITRGWDPRAQWMRLTLRNSAPLGVERWLEVGHPQMAHMTAHIPRGPGWESYNVGALEPLMARPSIGRTYGVVPVSLPAQSTQTVWVRMQSDTIIILRAKAWEPDEFKRRALQRQFWSSVGIGGLCVTVVFALLMLALTRQAAYGFFAVGMLGQFITVSMVSGIFQRFFWPQDWMVTTSIRDIGAFIAVFGLYRFLRAFLPQAQRHPVLLGAFRVAVYISLFFLLLSLLGLNRIDVIWFGSVTCSGLLATAICARAWREGDRAAGIMMIAFGILVVFSAIRVLVMTRLVAFVPEVTQVPFLGIFLGTPVVLLGLVDRTRQLQDELSRVQAESAAQLRFLAQMSHELRSPLDNILGNAQLLAREARSGAQVSGLNSIFDSGRQLLRNIDHILDYARGAAGMLRVEPAPLHLGTFLRGMERMARVLAAQRNNRFELTFQGDPAALRALTVMADAERLRQVLGNLLANAARHTREGVITLQLGNKGLKAGQVQLAFTVQDTGEGISAQEQKRIFRPFERAESKASHAGKGAGLGLAIARQLAELMGGRLSVRSAPGLGASFRFSVPLRQLPPQRAAHPDRLEGFDAAGYLGPRRTVLVVDDEAAGRAVLCQLLEGLGFEVLSAHSGAAAVALLPTLGRLDLVLTDQYMPDGDGWLVLEKVAELMPEVPVVLISAAPPSPPLIWNPQLRFAAQFLRPVEHAPLLARMGDLLDLHWSDVAVLRDPQTPAPAQPAPDAPAQALPSQPMQRPAAEQLQALAQLVELGQVTAIQEWAQRLQMQQPEYADFAGRILEAVRSLDLPGLLDLVSDTVPGVPFAPKRPA